MAKKGYLQRTKVGIRRRLTDMNEQISAIDKMSSNMEAEFRDTRLVRAFSVLFLLFSV